MTYHWYRTFSGAYGFHNNASWMCAIPAGSTYRRVRFSWGFTGWTSDIVPMHNMAAIQLIMGLCTTIGNGTEAVPNPATTTGDVAPPTQRFIWWESRSPVPTAVDHNSGIMTWRDSGNQERVDTKAQVLATGIPGGDTLNLWASWGVPTAWDTSGDANVWVATAVLYSTP